MITRNLSVVRGDAPPLRFTLENADGSGPLDLTGVAGIRFTAKVSADDADVDAIIAKTIGDGITVTSATDGVLIVQLEPEDIDVARTLLWDLQVTDSAGPHTVMGGQLIVTRDISRTTP
jgi:hypothetical protein